MDGFLLLGESIPQIRNLFDIRLLLRASFADAKRRREARDGYATIEGWWQDPPEYVDKVVWPGYVEEHAFLFKQKDADGEIDQAMIEKLGIDVAPLGSLEEALRWTVGTVKSRIVALVK